MALNILFEDGKGDVVDEYGNDPMEEVVVASDIYALETLSNLEICKEKMPAAKTNKAQLKLSEEEGD
jgi:hypothetical protein